MRARFAVLLVLAALLAGGCGESDSGNSGAEQTSTPTPKDSGPGGY